MNRLIPFLLSGSLAGACASSAPTPSLSGTLRLVPPEVVASLPQGSGSYGDRRYRDATPVDYSRPGFAVVYLEGTSTPAPVVGVELKLRDSARGPSIVPAHSAAGIRGEIRVSNDTREAQVVACPEADWLTRIEPGAAVEFHPRQGGTHSIALLGAAGEPASVFVAPGPFEVVSPRGNWQFFDVSPGAWNVRTWHPRFPSTQESVTVSDGEESRLELRVSTQTRDKGTP